MEGSYCKEKRKTTKKINTAYMEEIGIRVATKKDHAPRKKRWTSGMFQMRKDFGRHRPYYRVT
jgi:hypothetical protein